MSVAVLVPFTPGRCEWRDRAWAWVRAHYAAEHPGWAVVTGSCDGEWSKGRAVADALAQTDADVMVIADADVLAPPSALRDAVSALRTHGWAIPHRKVHRLDQDATQAFYAGRTVRRYDRPPYKGVAGGGLVVLTRAAYEECPIDPRFLGWGGEDVSWGWALNALKGPPWRGDADLTHLWHPTVRVGHLGGPESRALTMRWRFATRRQGALLHIMLGEAREALWASV